MTECAACCDSGYTAEPCGCCGQDPDCEDCDGSGFVWSPCEVCSEDKQ